MTKLTKEDSDLLEELGVDTEATEQGSRSPLEERLLAGFEDIQRFRQEHGRAPEHGEGRDIFERLYAVRLDRLRSAPEYVAVLSSVDHQGLLAGGGTILAPEADELDDDALLAELSVAAAPDDITDLRHVRSAAEKRETEEIATRRPCQDFSRFGPIFTAAKADLASGLRTTRRFSAMPDIAQGELFIVGGQIAYVAAIGAEFVADYGRPDSRLRVIYDNGTESDVLLRSLQRALYRDEAGRRITDPSAGPLFANDGEEGDVASGTIYVLRSQSSHPVVAANRAVVHKIGVTGGDLERRIANAKLDPTFLMADVEIVSTYKLANLNRTRLENLIHRVFDAARLNIEVMDRFGHPIVPREWFLVPLFVIDEAVQKIRDGTIVDYTYAPTEGQLVTTRRR